MRLVIVLLMIVTGSLQAEKGELKVHNRNSSPVTINSNSMQLETKSRTFTYTGNVVVTQDDLKMTCKELVGRYNEKNEIETLLAKQDVVINKGPDLTAYSDLAEYFPSEDMVVLKQNPRVIKEANELRAETIRLYLETEKTAAEGQVQMRMVQDQK